MKTSILKLLLAVIALVLLKVGYAQDSIRYVNAALLMVTGKAKATDTIFHRIEGDDAIPMPDALQSLSKNSTGIAVIFETNSKIIRARWKLAGQVYLSNMTPIAHSGLDLYCLKNGKWQFVSIGRVAAGTDQNQLIIQNMDSTMKQFMLYLPLYNTVNDLQIGVQKDALINIPSQPRINKSKRIVIYGSSITQGASASRPGMAYPAILQRKTGYDVINLGFSGSAKMEMALSKYLATVTADCFVLDCIPNPTFEQIKERSYDFVKNLRNAQPNTPIILVESVFSENGNWDQKLGENVRKKNEEIRKTYEQLKKEGLKNIYYVESSKLIGSDHEATIDGTHLTDLGFTRIAEALMPVIAKALREHR